MQSASRIPLPQLLWPSLLSVLALCALGTPRAQAADAEWKPLFDGKSTAGWRGYGKPSFPTAGWVVQDGWLAHLSKGGGDVVTDQQFDQFDLEWEWKLEAGGNSGIKYFVQENRPSAPGHEYQLLDDAKHPDAIIGDGKRVTASFYDVVKPEIKLPLRPPGEINKSRLVVRGNTVEHWLNGVKVLTYECGSEAVKEAVAKSKFKSTPGFGLRAKGNILLQDHGDKVWFRNIRIRDLSAQ